VRFTQRELAERLNMAHDKLYGRRTDCLQQSKEVKQEDVREVVDVRQAFDEAVVAGMPSEDVYHYMYMFSTKYLHHFKHADTREYVRYTRPSC
jgi:hypothetical protein